MEVRKGPGLCVFIKFPGDSDIRQSLRTTACRPLFFCKVPGSYHVVSVAVAQLRHCSEKAAIDNMLSE